MRYKHRYGFAILILLIFVILAIIPSDEEKSFVKMEEETRLPMDDSKEMVHSKNETMAEQLDAFIAAEPVLDGALVGVSVRSASTGEILYDHFGDTRFHPASNMKLLTGAAALSTLGKDYTFRTEIKTDGDIDKDTLKGNLYLIGKGDPTLLPSDFSDFAAKLRHMGIKQVDGDVVGDDTWFDNVPLSPDLIWSDENFYYGAQISALTLSPDTDYDAGSVVVRVRPGKIGDKPSISVAPETEYVDIKNRAETVDSDVKEDLTVERQHGTNDIIVEGTIAVDATDYAEWIAVWDPSRFALAVFQKALSEQGIAWTGDVTMGESPDQADTLLTHDSMSLAELMVPFMKLSNNTHAEIFVKEMGKVKRNEGSWEDGLKVMEEALADLDMDTDKLLIRDGSGISHVNMIPPHTITKLLYDIQGEDWFEVFADSFPVAGEKDRMVGGTLSDRMDGLAVKAKTGTIFGVSTLSGFLETTGDETLIFSIMLNNLLDEEDGPAIEDELVKIISGKT